MRRLVPGPRLRARLVIVAGLVLIAAAAWLAGRWPVALLVGGVEAVVYGLVFMDEDGPSDQVDQGGGSDGQRPS